MNRRFASTLVAGAALLVQLDRTAYVGGVPVPAGSYRVDVAATGDTAKLSQGQKVVAEVACKSGAAKSAYPGTAVHYASANGAGPDRLTKIVFADQKLQVEFPAVEH